MSFYVRIFPVADRRHAAGEFPLFGVQQIGRMHFLGNVLGIHLVQDVLERRDVLTISDVRGLLNGFFVHGAGFQGSAEEVYLLPLTPEKTTGREPPGMKKVGKNIPACRSVQKLPAGCCTALDFPLC